MTYSLNPTDPFAEPDEDIKVIVPADRPDTTVHGTRALFVELEPVDGTRWHKEKACAECDQILVVPEGYPIIGQRLFVMCPSRHYSTTITVPEGFALGGEWA